MIGRLYLTELGLLLRDMRARAVGIVLSLLIVVTFGVALRDAMIMRQNSHEVSQLERSRWLGQDPKNPHTAAHYGAWIFKDSSPLAVLDPGVDPYVGRMVRLEAHKYNDAIFRSAQDMSPLSQAGSGTVADIVHLILPLAAILLGFSMFAADRERGTLRVALGNGVAPAKLLTARFAALMTVLAMSAGAPLLILGWIAGAVLDGGAWQAGMRVLLWTAMELAYAAVFLALALAASIMASTARIALTVSLLAWALFCVVMPRMAAAGVEVIAPTPSQAATLAKIDDIIMLNNRADHHDERRKALLAEYGVDDPEDLPVNLSGTLMHEREQHDYKVYDDELGKFNARLERQDEMSGWAGLLSPMVAAQSVSQTLAGSDYRRHVDFLTKVEAYRRVLIDTMNLDLAANPVAGTEVYVGNRSLWERVPPFAYTPPSLMRSLSEAAAPIAILLAWMMSAAAIAFAAVRKIKP